MNDYKINVIYNDNENLNKLITSALILEIKKLLKENSCNKNKNCISLSRTLFSSNNEEV